MNIIDAINQYPMLSVVAAFVLFFILFNLYFQIAKRYDLIDRPNERSSHSSLTIVGAGILFYFSFVIYEIICLSATGVIWLPYLFSGATLLTIISFIDDRKTLPNSIRLSAHFISAALLLIQLNLYLYLSIPLLILIAVLIVGSINAYNFMDGINGITGLYSLVTLISLFVLRSSGDLDLLYYLLGISVLVFLFYNFRFKAKCFCGDVGSISIAYILLFFLLLLMVNSGSWEYILFLAIYGVDSVLTIVHRISKRENIFQAHRSHIYQLLVHENNWSHLKVSSVYAVAQAVINIGIIILINSDLSVKIAYTVVVFIILGLCSIVLRKRLSQ